MLGMPEPRVRELARDALVELAPVSVRGVEDDWRGQLADYVLGQQSGPEATATKGHLRRSEAARSWARSLLDSLEQLYPNGSVPAIPEGERGRGARRPAACRSRRVRAGREHRRPPRTLDRRPRDAPTSDRGAGVAAPRAAARRAPVADRRAHRRRRRQQRHRQQRRRPARRPDHDGPGPAGRRRTGRRRGRGRPQRQEAAARAGRAARAERAERGLLRVALQQPGRRQVARRTGHRPAGQLPGHRRVPDGLREVQVHRRDEAGNRQQHEREALRRVRPARPDAEDPGRQEGHHEEARRGRPDGAPAARARAAASRGS